MKESRLYFNFQVGESEKKSGRSTRRWIENGTVIRRRWRSCAVLVCSSVAVIWWPHSSYITLSALVSSAELMCVPATNQLQPPTWLFLESPPLLQLVECIILIPLKCYSFPIKNAHEGIVASSNLDIIHDDWRHHLLSSHVWHVLLLVVSYGWEVVTVTCTVTYTAKHHGSASYSSENYYHYRGDCMKKRFSLVGANEQGDH